MTITFPRPFPAIAGFRAVDFDLVDPSAVNDLRGGSSIGVELADCYWTASFELKLSNAAERAEWRAWAATLRAIRKFFAFNPDRAYPIAYGSGVLNLLRAVGGGFDGTATLIGSSSGSLTISTLPANYQFTVGDHVSGGYAG